MVVQYNIKNVALSLFRVAHARRAPVLLKGVALLFGLACLFYHFAPVSAAADTEATLLYSQQNSHSTTNAHLVLQNKSAFSVQDDGDIGACLATDVPLLEIDATDADFIGDLLNSLLGVDLELTEGDLEILAAGSLGLDDLLTSLEEPLELSTPDEILNADVTLPQLLDAAATVANNDGNLMLAGNLEALESPTASLTETIRLADLIQLDTSLELSEEIEINALNLLNAAIQRYNNANITVAPPPITISGDTLGLAATVDTVEVQIQVLESPLVVACGAEGTEIETGGVRAKFALDVANLGLSTGELEDQLETLLSVLPGAVEVSASLGELALYVEVGSSTGLLELLDAVNDAVTVEADPGSVALYLGSIDDAIFFDRTRPLSATTDLQFGTVGSVVISGTAVGGEPVTADIQLRSYVVDDSGIGGDLNFTGPYSETLSLQTRASLLEDSRSALLANAEVQLSGDLGPLLDPLVDTTILPALDESLTDALDDTLAQTLPTLTIDLLGNELGLSLDTLDLLVLDLLPPRDSDDDGVPDEDEDVDGDGNLEDDDTDGDGTPNYQDADDDGDGIPSGEEDANGNGDPRDDDTDGDGTPDYLDADDDGDDIPSTDEDTNNNGDPRDDDTDDDGVPNYQDADDDGDGVPTKEEDLNNNGNPNDDDSDGDGIPNHLDPDPPVVKELSEKTYLPIITRN